MKKQKLDSKLSLKKITISKLDPDQFQHIVGGESIRCVSEFCATKRGIKCIEPPKSDRLCDYTKIWCVA